MNTPSHAIINYAILSLSSGEGGSRSPWPILVGSVLPDAPLLVLIIWARVTKIPSTQLWTATYWQPFWQDFTHYFHSIPLALTLVLLAAYFKVGWLQYLGLSMVLHNLGDLPLHHDDAHRHFLPLSQYRWISPVSYWDRNHYAVWGALAENLSVLVATLYLLPNLHNWWAKGGLLAWNTLGWSVYVLIYLVPTLNPSDRP